MQRFQELRHPLKQSLPEMDRSTQEKLTDCWRMRERMWEHHFLSTDIGGHLRGTLDTWSLLSPQETLLVCISEMLGNITNSTKMLDKGG